MIFHLLDLIAKARPASFPDFVVGAAPTTPPPHIALYPGQLTANQASRDTAGEPRPRPWRQDIAPVKGTTVYPIAKTPLSGTVRCQAVYNQDKPEELIAGLVEGDDYQVDYKAPAIAVTTAGAAKLETAGSLRVYYSFVGIYGVQEFKQLFYADVIGATIAEAEQWSSLLVGLIVLGHDSFVEAFNGAGGGYQSGEYVSGHLLDNYAFIEGSTVVAATSANVHLTFEARGQLALSREMMPDFGLIQRIVSRGKLASGNAIDIDAGVG